MTGKITRDAYQKMIQEDIEWLDSMPKTLEREHIRAIVILSPQHEYSECDAIDAQAAELQALRAQVAALRLPLEFWRSILIEDINDAPKGDVVRECQEEQLAMVDAALAATPDEALRVIHNLLHAADDLIRWAAMPEGDGVALLESVREARAEGERLFGAGGAS